MGSKANSYDSPVAIICLYFNFYILTFMIITIFTYIFASYWLYFFDAFFVLLTPLRIRFSNFQNPFENPLCYNVIPPI